MPVETGESRPNNAAAAAGLKPDPAIGTEHSAVIPRPANELPPDGAGAAGDAANGELVSGDPAADPSSFSNTFSMTGGGALDPLLDEGEHGDIGGLGDDLSPMDPAIQPAELGPASVRFSKPDAPPEVDRDATLAGEWTGTAGGGNMLPVAERKGDVNRKPGAAE